MTFSTTADIIAFVSEALPDFTPTGEVRELTGGYLNHVWRVFGQEGTAILKYAPPYAAKAPEIPVSQNRILIEAAALLLFEQAPLQSILSDALRPPGLLHATPERHAIILEDVGNLPPLDAPELIRRGMGARLGAFLSKLHGSTFRNEAIASRIHNIEIQQSRLEVQYTQVQRLLAGYGARYPAELGRKARALGEKYLSKGKCLIMGDLWPRSILIDTRKGQLRIIDWEFAHFGRPAQDVAHLLAHLWMLQHRAGAPERTAAFRQLQEEFVEAYMSGIATKGPSLFGREEIEDAGIHFGAELLARTIGSFQNGYLYEGLAHRHPTIGEAVDEAIRYLSEPEMMARLLIHRK